MTAVLTEPWRRISARNTATLSNEITRLLTHGLAMPGDPLPSERKLADGLGVSRVTVRTALAKLEEEGVVEREGARLRRLREDPARQKQMHQTIAIIDGHPLKANAFGRPGWSSYIHVSALAEVQRIGFQALSSVLPRDSDGDPMLARLMRDRPTGVLLPSSAARDHPCGADLMRRLQAAGIPLVAHADASEDALPADVVCTDHRRGGELLAGYLSEHGFKRPLRLYNSDRVPCWLRQRDAGFEQVFKEAGVDVREALVVPVLKLRPGLSETEEFEQHTRSLAGYLAPALRSVDSFDVIVCVNDQAALRMARACRYLGIEPGKEIAITGYDNAWQQSVEFQLEPTPPIVSIEKHHDRIGVEMVQLLHQRFEGELAPEPARVTVEPELTVPQRRIAPS